MGPPDNAKLARMTLGKPCQASYWAPRASHPSGDSEIKVSVRVLSVNGVQSGAKRSNSGSTDLSVCLRLAACGCLACAAELDYEPEGREFESLRARHFSTVYARVLDVPPANVARTVAGDASVTSSLFAAATT